MFDVFLSQHMLGLQLWRIILFVPHENNRLSRFNNITKSFKTCRVVVV